MKKFLSITITFIIATLVLSIVILQMFSRRYEQLISSISLEQKIALQSKYGNLAVVKIPQHLKMVRNVRSKFEDSVLASEKFSWKILSNDLKDFKLQAEDVQLEGTSLKNLPLTNELKEEVLSVLTKDFNMEISLVNQDDNLFAIQNEDVVCKLNFFSELYCGDNTTDDNINYLNALELVESIARLYRIGNPIQTSKMSLRIQEESTIINREIESYSLAYNKDSNIDEYLNSLGFKVNYLNSISSSVAELTTYSKHGIACQILFDNTKLDQADKILTCGVIN